MIGQANTLSPIAKEPEAKRSSPKTHASYWTARLEHRTYTQDGHAYEGPEWSVRIHFGGNRKSFDLETGSKVEAAAKARDIYLSLIAKGWAATTRSASDRPLVLRQDLSPSFQVSPDVARARGKRAW